MNGKLDSLVFPQVLRDLYLARRTGVLEVEGEGSRARIYLSAGSVVFASSDQDQLRLGEILVRTGVLDHAELLVILANLPADKKLGRYLITDKRIPADKVHRALEAQIRAIILPVFNWVSGSYRFIDGAEVDTDELVSNISMADLFLDGVRQMSDFTAIRDFMFETNPRLTLVDDPFDRFQKLTLTTEEAFVFSRIDGTRSLREICDMAPTPDEHTCRIVFALLAAGITQTALQSPQAQAGQRAAARPEGTPPVGGEDLAPETRQRIATLYQRISDYTHYQLLGVPPDAPTEEIDQAFQQRAAKYHPDHFHQPEIKSQLEVIFARTVEAWKVLCDPAARQEYDALRASPALPDEDEAESLEADDEVPAKETEIPPCAPAPAQHQPPSMSAGEWYQNAVGFLGEQQYWRAIQCLQRAVKIEPGNGMYHYMLAQTLARNPMWRRDAEAEYLKAIELSPANTAYLLGLGRLYKRGGRIIQAQKIFSDILKSNPRCKDALNELPESAGGKAGGIAGSFFKALRKKK